MWDDEILTSYTNYADSVIIEYRYNCTTGHKCHFVRPRNVIHIISFEPISKKSTSKSSHETSMKSEDAIGTFWQATTKELYHVT